MKTHPDSLPQHCRDARLNGLELCEQLFDKLLLQSLSLVTVDVRTISTGCQRWYQLQDAYVLCNLAIHQERAMSFHGEIRPHSIHNRRSSSGSRASKHAHHDAFDDGVQPRFFISEEVAMAQAWRRSIKYDIRL
jgi:hypothetical protein